MHKGINIDISGIKQNIITTMEAKFNTSNIQVVNNKEENILQLQVSESFNEDFLLDAIDSFLSKFQDNQYALAPYWFFDDMDLVIKSPKKNYFLTQKEALFLKTLIKRGGTLTYSDMLKTIWDDSENVTKNAIRLFARNLRRKLPPDILRNLQGIGYRLEL